MEQIVDLSKNTTLSCPFCGCTDLSVKRVHLNQPTSDVLLDLDFGHDPVAVSSEASVADYGYLGVCP